MDDLDAVADALYAGDPTDFIARRDTAAAQARQDGDRSLATRIGRLRRPTLSAWAVNLLAREATVELGALLDLGDALAAAQEGLSGPDLRRLSTERNLAVHALSRRAASLAAESGRPLTPAARDEVTATLQAAIADPQIRDLVRTGRLDRARVYSGFGPGAGATVPGGARRSTTSSPAEAPGPTMRPPSAQPRPDRAALLRARTRVVEAEAELASAEDDERAAGQAAVSAWEGTDRAGQEVADLRDELAAAERLLANARSEAEAADHARAAARSAVDRLRRALEAARTELATLEHPSPT